MSGYDSHLFIKTFGNSEGDISCVPNNEENYISFTKQIIVDKFVNKEEKEVIVKRELRFFIESLRFMAAWLDNLSSNLKIDQFVSLSKYYSGNQSFVEKGCISIELCWFDEKIRWHKSSFKRSLYSKLTDERITDEDTSMLKLLGRNLILSKWRITTTCTIYLMYYY